ncbi:hypothetical protein ABIA22_002272 [Sinorhizobium fredii]|uniref:hypothetical protein n=1 Tax=Rhizobium fredii TaxID=380 RepID=UPI0035117BA4
MQLKVVHRFLLMQLETKGIKLPGYVYIVESPSPRDLFDGRTEGTAICETFKLSGTKHSYSLAVNRAEFERAFALGAGQPFSVAFDDHGQEPPVVHLSMHGSSEGVQLTDGQIITWEELRAILSPINSALPLGLMVTFSTCGGASSIAMSMILGNDEKPFFATVGSIDNVPWDDSLIAYSVFYHHWFKGTRTDQCVELMKAASGHEGFRIYSGEKAKQDFIEYVRKRRGVGGREIGGNHPAA